MRPWQTVLIALAAALAGAATVAVVEPRSTDGDRPAPVTREQVELTSRHAVDCGRANYLALMARTDKKARACMEQAREDRKTATLWTEGGTPEGDPIIMVFWLNRDGTLSRTTDTRADAWGPQQVTHRRCVTEAWLTTSVCA